MQVSYLEMFAYPVAVGLPRNVTGNLDPTYNI